MQASIQQSLNKTVKIFQQKYTNPCCHHIICSKSLSGQETLEYSGHLFLGGASALSRQVVENYKISAVLTLMDNWTYQYCDIDEQIKKSKISPYQHKWVKLEDSTQSHISPFFNECIQFIKSKLENKNVLVHCYIGVSRSASIVLAFLMKEYKMKFKQALAYVSSIRDTVSPNQTFIKDLEKFEKQTNI